MRAVEGLLFLSLATGVHLGLWAVAPGTGGLPQGGEAEAVTLTAAPPQAQALVESWTQAPAAATAPAAPAAPQAAGLALPTTPAPLLAPGRDDPAAITPPSQDAVARADMTPLPRPALPAIPDAPPTPETAQAPDLSPRPEARPETPRPAQPAPPVTARAPAPDTTPAEPQPRTAGAAAPKAQAANASAAKGAAPGAQALQADWGARIQRKVHRALRHPGGTAGEGTARVALVVDRAGRLAGLRLIASSGVDAFDRAALSAVERAGRFPAAPEGLGDASYTFTLSLSFRR